jgi:hypothetical protein
MREEGVIRVSCELLENFWDFCISDETEKFVIAQKKHLRSVGNLKKTVPLTKNFCLCFCQAPLTFSSWNQIIKDMRNIYKLKELINLPITA